jgi:hypothetical protein
MEHHNTTTPQLAYLVANFNEEDTASNMLGQSPKTCILYATLIGHAKSTHEMDRARQGLLRREAQLAPHSMYTRATSPNELHSSSYSTKLEQIFLPSTREGRKV